MKIEFYVNDQIPLDTLVSSMQLDSNQTVAHLKVDGFDITLEVKGSVRVIWNDEVYKTPSDFPEELKQIFVQQKDQSQYPNLFVDDNNWYEIFIEKDGKFINSEVVDDLYYPDVPYIFEMLYEIYEDYKEDTK